MSDFWQRNFEEQERMRRLIEPAHHGLDLAQQGSLYGHSTVARYAEAEADKQRRMIDGLVGHSALMSDMMSEMDRNRQLAEEHLRIVRGLSGYSQLEANSFLNPSPSLLDRYEQSYRTPETRELGPLARAGIAASQLAAGYAVEAPTLARMMGQVRAPWLSETEGAASIRALADIASIGHGLRTNDPFNGGFAGALRVSLGDWRDEVTAPREILIDPIRRTTLYQERGVDLTLTEFHPAAFEQGIRAGGLIDEDDDIGGDDDAVRAGVAFDRLRRFEVEIRGFIVRVMEAAFGDSWMRRQLPPGMFERWREKQAQAVKIGEAELPLIDYADFSDYRLIIERSDNWKSVFKPVFGRLEDVRESLQRLQPIRIATMHARIVTLDDVLLLHVETRRILRVARVRAA